MNYLRNLVPHMATNQAPSRPHPISRHSECSDDGHLLPSPRLDDDTELPPFVPTSDDRTSLSQVESNEPDLNLDQLPRLYRPYSDMSSLSSTFYNPLERGSRSDPATPAPASTTRYQSPCRRNSTPASRRLKPKVTFHPNSPLSARQSEYESFLDDRADEDDGNMEPYEDVAPDNLSNYEGSGMTMASIIAADSRRPSGTSAVINQWLDTAEGFRSPCAEHINQLPTRVQTLPPDADPMSGVEMLGIGRSPFDDPVEPESLDDFEGFEGTHRPTSLERAETEPSLSVPHEIRLRRASKQKQLDMRRKSMPHLADTSSSVVRPGDSSTIPPFPLSLKSSVAEPVLTHAWTSNFAPEDTTDEQSAIIRPPGSTLQVVQSRDSVYEVIWEDSKPRSTKQNVMETRPNAITDHIATSLPNESIPIDTTMAAWYWKGSSDNSTSALHTVKMPTNPHSSRPIPIVSHAEDDPQSLDTSIEVDSLLGPHMPARPHIVEMRRASSTDSRPDPRTSPSMSSVIDASNRPPSPIAYVAPSAISARQRRELLGNRKFSNNSSPEDHFTGHRDSLVLAHKRIFHDHEKHLNAAHGDEAPDLRIDQLRRETWHIKIPESPALTDSSESFGSNEEVVDHFRKVDVPVSILVHGLQQGERPRAVKSASVRHIKLMVEDDAGLGE